jgi:acyl dehydratase
MSLKTNCHPEGAKRLKDLNPHHLSPQKAKNRHPEGAKRLKDLNPHHLSPQKAKTVILKERSD